jgi:MFS superfamily sulfate permease-like transporter
MPPVAPPADLNTLPTAVLAGLLILLVIQLARRLSKP